MTKHPYTKLCHVSCIYSDRPSWFTSGQQNRQELRSLEREWRKSNLQFDRHIFIEVRNNKKTFLDELKIDYYKSKISDAANSQEMFRIIDEISGTKALGSNITDHYFVMLSLTFLSRRLLKFEQILPHRRPQHHHLTILLLLLLHILTTLDNYQMQRSRC